MSEDNTKISELPKSSPTSNSGIPKPMAAVKGMSKPTHSVAPMPQVTSQESEPNNVSGQKVSGTTILCVKSNLLIFNHQLK